MEDVFGFGRERLVGDGLLMVVADGRVVAVGDFTWCCNLFSMQLRAFFELVC